jgi:PAS domain S-box-containing protein
MVITKFRGHLSIVLERASVYLEIAENTFARLQKSGADKLKAVRQRLDNELRKLRARSRDSFIVANEIFARLGSQASSASRKAAVQLRKAQQAAAGFGRASVDKVQKLRRESENELRKLRAGGRVAIVAADTKITQLGGQVSSVSRQVTRKLLKARDAITALGRTIADKPRRMREVRLTRENDLRNLLASSMDAIVVTDGDRRLVAANAKALELFGISESNLGNFTVDAFLANVELPDLDLTDSSFEHREVRVNRCKIRKLDGGLRVAECQFVAGIVPRRHLYKFLNVAPYKITPPRFAKRNGSAASLRTAESPSNSVPNATVPAKKIPRRGVGPAF